MKKTEKPKDIDLKVKDKQLYYNKKHAHKNNKVLFPLSGGKNKNKGKMVLNDLPQKALFEHLNSVPLARTSQLQLVEVFYCAKLQLTFT